MADSAGRKGRVPEPVHNPYPACVRKCVCVLKSTRKTLRKDSVCVCVWWVFISPDPHFRAATGVDTIAANAAARVATPPRYTPPPTPPPHLPPRHPGPCAQLPVAGDAALALERHALIQPAHLQASTPRVRVYGTPKPDKSSGGGGVYADGGRRSYTTVGPGHPT